MNQNFVGSINIFNYYKLGTKTYILWYISYVHSIKYEVEATIADVSIKYTLQTITGFWAITFIMTFCRCSMYIKFTHKFYPCVQTHIFISNDVLRISISIQQQEWHNE